MNAERHLLLISSQIFELEKCQKRKIFLTKRPDMNSKACVPSIRIHADAD